MMQINQTVFLLGPLMLNIYTRVLDSCVTSEHVSSSKKFFDTKRQEEITETVRDYLVLSQSNQYILKLEK